jgi:alkanesulfonate monooxygenase SsuD/methylene tetrahydromethanopterin reductase-like flavin-dependent oxidoreductase (luciferase family)
MHFGVFTTLQNRTWPDLLDLWRHVEATGWDIACVPDHLAPYGPTREGTNLEALSSLSALAALVPRIRLGTIVLSNTFRHPAVLAKTAAQIDIISGGRLVLGLGTGWYAGEHGAYGIPLPPMRERLERLDEACQVIRSLWMERRSTFNGRHYQLSDAALEPSPCRRLIHP